jgi:uncharacterized glyoxalase superfamily protein PhnB
MRTLVVEEIEVAKVHGQSAEAVTKRPWGERSFYVVDPLGNDLCFVEEGTLYT